MGFGGEGLEHLVEVLGSKHIIPAMPGAYEIGNASERW